MSEFMLYALGFVLILAVCGLIIGVAMCYNQDMHRWEFFPNWWLLLGKPWVVLADHNGRKAFVTFRAFLRQIREYYAEAFRISYRPGIPGSPECFDEREVAVFSESGIGVTGTLDELHVLLQGCITVPGHFFVPSASPVVDLKKAYQLVYGRKKPSPSRRH